MKNIRQIISFFLIGMLFLSLGDILEYSVSLTQIAIKVIAVVFLVLSGLWFVYSEIFQKQDDQPSSEQKE